MDIIDTLAFCFCEGIGVTLGSRLLETFESASNILKENPAHLLKIDGIHHRLTKELHNKENFLKAERELDFVQKEGIEILVKYRENYPQKLVNCIDAPLVLFLKGKNICNNEKSLAIVGTRRASRYGIEETKNLICQLKLDKPTIISGLAYGIDTQAHLSALEYQLPTLAVLAGGLKEIYPKENEVLAHKIMETGGILSEMPSFTVGKPGLFPRRNRIIAGLSDAVVVVEASIKGGALITAKIAHSYNKDIFAIPGRNHAHFSEGCNFLIKSSMAYLLQTANDIREVMNWHTKFDAEKSVVSESLQLTTYENEIMELLKMEEELLLEEIAIKTNIPIPMLLGYLLNLELGGIILSLPGKKYRLSSLRN